MTDFDEQGEFQLRFRLHDVSVAEMLVHIKLGQPKRFEAVMRMMLGRKISPHDIEEITALCDDIDREREASYKVKEPVDFMKRTN